MQALSWAPAGVLNFEEKLHHFSQESDDIVSFILLINSQAMNCNQRRFIRNATPMPASQRVVGTTTIAQKRSHIVL